jgi:meiotic recombination protein SPO11
MPSLRDILSVDMACVKWILVVEKEATFRSIAASTFWQTISTDGVMVTAKGYPDIATRAMLRYLCMPLPQNAFATPPIYGLVDYDPDGLAIFSTYKHGSIGLAHESADLVIPQLRWIGLRIEQILACGDDLHAGQGLLTLSERDRKRARSMLGWEVLASEDDLKQELQTMLMLNMKAELQLLDALPGGTQELLQRMLPRYNWLELVVSE